MLPQLVSQQASAAAGSWRSWSRRWLACLVLSAGHITTTLSLSVLQESAPLVFITSQSRRRLQSSADADADADAGAGTAAGDSDVGQDGPHAAHTVFEVRLALPIALPEVPTAMGKSAGGKGGGVTAACMADAACARPLQVAPYSVQGHVHQAEHNFSNVAAVHGPVSHAVVHFFGSSAPGKPQLTAG